MPIKKILVADDSATARYFLVETLSRMGIQVITAQDGDEAVFKACTEMPDLILMDVMMPGTDGFSATRLLSSNQATKHIPVIILTGKDRESDRMLGFREGAKDFVSKPVSPAALLAKIRKIEEDSASLAVRR